MSPVAARLIATRPITPRVGLFVLLVSFFWSGNIVSIKIGIATIPPMWSAFWRMLVGVLVVAAWARLTGKGLLPAREHVGDLLLLAALFTAQIATFNEAVHFTSPAYAVILLNTNPVMVNLISHFSVKADRLTWQRVCGLAIPFCGIAYVMLGQPDAALAPRPVLGNSLMLVSALLLAIRIVFTQRIVRAMGAYRPVVWQMLLSLPPFLALAAASEPPLLQPLTALPVVAILYQAVVVAGFCFVAWTTLLQLYSAGNLAIYSFSVPIFGVILAALVFSEAITGRLVVGAAAVAAGIAIVTGAKRAEGPRAA